MTRPRLRASKELPPLTPSWVVAVAMTFREMAVRAYRVVRRSR